MSRRPPCKYGATEYTLYCEATATLEVLYRNGSGPVHSTPVCARHSDAEQGRAYPGVLQVRALSSAAPGTPLPGQSR